MIAWVKQTARLAATSVREVICVTDGGSEAKSEAKSWTVGVNTLNIHTVTSINATVWTTNAEQRS